MFRTTFGDYCFSATDDYPSLYSEYCQKATLAEFFRSEYASCSLSVILVAKDDNWPFLVVAQEYSPGPENGFYPGLIFIPETQLLFIGAGERLLIYVLDQDSPKKIREEVVDGGFWSWRRYEEYIMMLSELELVAWDKYGKKLWACPVEPPWTYTIKDDLVLLDVMGKKISFSLRDGPSSQNLS